MVNLSFKKACALVAMLGATAALSRAAAPKIYEEAGGVVVIEAEHFDTRVNDAADATIGWKIVPDEDPGTGSGPNLNARGNKYIESLPDAGVNKGGDVGTPPYVEYKVAIGTPGTYRLFLRFSGWDGGSDSIYAQIMEMKKSNGGPGPDWYRYIGQKNPPDDTSIVDFALINNTTTGGSAIGWNGDGGPELTNAGGGEVAAVWNLSAGVYTIRISIREDGSALDALLLQLTSLPQPTNPGPAESALATFYITQSPVDSFTTPGKTATFTVAATATGAITYKWQSKAPGAADFSDIPGATSASYTTATVTDAMGGTQYRALVSSGGKTLTSGAATLITDAAAPTIILANGSPDLKQVTVTFNEKLNDASATTAANYSINNGVTVTSATLDASGKVVTLKTSNQTSGTAYTLTVNGVKDIAGNATANATTPFQGASPVAGALRVDLWFNIGGTPIDGLTSDPRYPNTPDRTTYWTLFGPFAAGNNYGDNFGGQVSGWLVPPVTGNYKFYLRSDDAGQLFLSTDDKQANETLIAEQTGCCNAFQDAEGTLSSTPIPLTAGKRYFIRGLYKEGGGDDYIQVGWRTPNDADLNAPPTAVIPGKYLQTLADPTASILISQQPANASVAANTPVTFTVAYSALSAFGTGASVQWQKAPAGSSTFADIAGATGNSLNLAFASATDSGAQYRAAITAGGTTVNSNPATLTVSADTTPPTVTDVSGTVSSVTVIFSEPIDPVTGAAKANYTLSGGGTVSSATVTSGLTQAGAVRLAVSGLTAGNSYTLTVSAVKDVVGNVVASTTKTFIAYHINDSFNDGQLPAGATVNGSANVQAAGGLNGTGFLELTSNLNGLQGTMIYPDTLSGGTATKLVATWKMYIGNGSGDPADGFAVSIAGDLDSAQNFGEEGAGTGLTISFDTYDNGGGEAPAISVKYGGLAEELIADGGNTVVKTNLAKATLVNSRWVDVGVQVDASGKITVQHDNIKYFDKVQIPGWTGIVGPKVGIGGRTGGQNERNWVDDFRVAFNSDVSLPQPPTISITSPANNATFAAGASVTITVNAQAPGSTVEKVEFFANGSKIGESTTAPYSLTIPNVPKGAYNVTAKITSGAGISVTSAPVKVLVGNPDTILYVHGGSAPNAADTAIINRLFGMAFDVVTVGDTASQTSDADGKVLVITSSTVGSGNVNTKFVDVAVPVINWEEALTDEFLFDTNDAGQHGSTGGQTDIQIVKADHPLAAGLTAGAHTIATSAQTFSWGTPAASAVIIATMADGTGHACIFGFEKGATLVDGSSKAAARRVHIFLTNDTYPALNDDGKKLVDAAINWAIGNNVTPPPQQAKLTASKSGNNITISWTNGGTLQKNNQIVGGTWVDVPGNSPQTLPIAGQAQFFRVKQ